MGREVDDGGTEEKQVTKLLSARESPENERKSQNLWRIRERNQNLWRMRERISGE